jgi:3-oxoacyl-[acyl-carrier protein] reductase
MVNLKQKTALVTGGSRGIGRAIVERLAADGADVVFSYLSNEAAAAEVAAAVTAAGGTAHAVRADLGEPGAGQALYERAEELLGPLDILVNNAGVAPRGVIADTSDEDFGAVLAVNLNSPFSLIREAARRMRDGGRIINVSTLNTVLAGPGMAPYAASKAALELLSRVAAFELGARDHCQFRPAGRHGYRPVAHQQPRRAQLGRSDIDHGARPDRPAGGRRRRGRPAGQP